MDDGLYHMDEIHFHMDESDHTNAIYEWIQHDESNFIHGWTWTSSMWLPHDQLHLLSINFKNYLNLIHVFKFHSYDQISVICLIASWWYGPLVSLTWSCLFYH
jgi:hypothetical protein